MSPVEIARHLKIVVFNKYSGILLLDAKFLNKKMFLLLAVDFATGDVVAHLVVEAETEENYIKLVDMVEKCGYEIKAIISDGNPAILALTQSKKEGFRKVTRRYPRPGIQARVKKKARLEDVSHQWCCIHAKWDLTMKLPKLNLKKEEKLHIQKLIHSVLFAKSLAAAKRQMKKLSKVTRNNFALHNQITLWIDERWEMLMTHHTLRINGRKIPRTNNTAENTISYINSRLKTLRRLRSYASAQKITNLIVVNYRTKPFAKPKNKLKRGKSPLNLVCGIKRKFDWMEFVKKSCS